MRKFVDFINNPTSTMNESVDYTDNVREGLVQAFNRMSLKDITVNFDFAKRADLAKLANLDKNGEVKFNGFVTKGEGNKSVPTISQKFEAEALMADPSEGEGVIVYVTMQEKNGLYFEKAEGCDFVATKISLEKFERVNSKFSLFIHTKDGKYQNIELGN